tara:strand:- start:1675 stop:2352 length:678 start_codon:yes stop_codon:yes gene_type:complete
MKTLYLMINLGTFLCAFFLSFDKKINYQKSWKSSFLSSVIIGIPFIIWDIIFTKNKFWGFNEEYITEIYIYNLPIEEILFFICIPFSCTFIYEVCKHYFKKLNMNNFNRVFYILIILYSIFLIISEKGIGYYTLSVVISSSLILLWLNFNNYYTYIPIAFFISIIPFLLVNGLLTGFFTEEPIVWYNENQKINQRIFTIPIEDVLYSFTLIVSNIIVFEKLKKQF